ncbi:cytochrome c biogenesis protein ResB [Streptomyces zagrosensis]|uniref:Cytochrome c biogenesis protein n=1 Tax=Streptomyces zagrosensis TaxID=1042984 RepID=A0A7W9QD08_9ACTN|nr:cytochrome c biogenesis protein ResB [Streptomyces zagrosensis]MBB5938021.1 cytochrome c biogenesis protein [Streptomyces zagrosensis]
MATTDTDADADAENKTADTASDDQPSGTGQASAEDQPSDTDQPSAEAQPGSVKDQRKAKVDAEAAELGAAGTQLSTAPVEGQAVPGSFGGMRAPGVLGALAWTGREVFGWLRWCWRQLTSMRVALLLLLLLSLGAIPGSLIPQSGVDPVKVEAFKAQHERLTPLYEKLGMFHVYSSVWFSAIYILLFVSLIGCIVPRTWQFVGQLRSRPPAAPRRLTRLPAYTTWRTEAEPEQVLAAARKVLRGRRFRTHVAGDAVAAEKGYLREVGNLLFHIALIVVLVAFAVGQLWKSEGGKLITEGDQDGFTNSLTQYDDFKSGAFFDKDNLEPFGFSLDSFDARYERSGSQRGTAREFRAHVKYWQGADGKEKKTSIEVNEPLEIAGNKVYLLSTGYAPVVTVRDGKGDIAYKGAVPFLQQDPNLTSSGVIKVPDYRDKNGKKEQLGFQGFFVPTWGGADAHTMFSQFPAPDNPVLFLTAYHGRLGIDGGLAQNVYQLKTDNMKQFKNPDGKAFAQKLLPGETMTLPNGAGSLEFDGIKTWASFQISHQPGNELALSGAVAALIGLAGSLFIQRRRVWVRAVPGKDGQTVVEMAGLGRSESAKLPEELADLAVALQADAPAEPEPEPESESTDPAEGARA